MFSKLSATEKFIVILIGVIITYIAAKAVLGLLTFAVCMLLVLILIVVVYKMTE